MSVTSNLATEERLSWLGTQLDNHGTVRIGPAAQQLGVSEMTIRRDLLELEGLGVARRVRGGAVAVGPVSFEGRRQTRAKAKSRIAAKLRPLIPATGAIGLDSSSTVLRLAGLLDRARDLVVVTNGRDAFGALQGKPGISPVLTGGSLEVHTGSLVGPLACTGATSVLLHRMFISAAALDPRLGSSETTINDAEVKKAMATVASDVVLAVDAAKLNTRALAPALAWDRITTLVTDLEPGDPRLEPYRAHVSIL